MPLSGTFFAGKSGSVVLDSVTLFGRKWSLRTTADEHKVTNFESPTVGDETWHEFIGGFSGGEVTIDCVGDPTLAMPARGSTVAFTLGIGGGHSVTGEMVVKGIDHSTDIDGVFLQSFSGRVTGPPTFA